MKKKCMPKENRFFLLMDITKNVNIVVIFKKTISKSQETNHTKKTFPKIKKKS